MRSLKTGLTPNRLRQRKRTQRRQAAIAPQPTRRPLKRSRPLNQKILSPAWTANRGQPQPTHRRTQPSAPCPKGRRKDGQADCLRDNAEAVGVLFYRVKEWQTLRPANTSSLNGFSSAGGKVRQVAAKRSAAAKWLPLRNGKIRRKIKRDVAI